ncbi:MAG: hypothetical protein A2007_02485 [Verrucomicrobia bacterium GWC2_42_7]|nr:MAG: hypothetical protein A2007_02485 [Verrucomicrobia bacterium GWC2_42_7]
MNFLIKKGKGFSGIILLLSVSFVMAGPPGKRTAISAAQEEAPETKQQKMMDIRSTPEEEEVATETEFGDTEPNSEEENPPQKRILTLKAELESLEVFAKECVQQRGLTQLNFDTYKYLVDNHPVAYRFISEEIRENKEESIISIVKDYPFLFRLIFNSMLKEHKRLYGRMIRELMCLNPLPKDSLENVEWNVTLDKLQQANNDFDNACISRLILTNNFLWSPLESSVYVKLGLHKSICSALQELEALLGTIPEVPLKEEILHYFYQEKFKPAINAIVGYIECPQLFGLPLVFEGYPLTFRAVFCHCIQNEKKQILSGQILQHLEIGGMDLESDALRQTVQMLQGFDGRKQSKTKGPNACNTMRINEQQKLKPCPINEEVKIAFEALNSFAKEHEGQTKSSSLNYEKIVEILKNHRWAYEAILCQAKNCQSGYLISILSDYAHAFRLIFSNFLMPEEKKFYSPSIREIMCLTEAPEDPNKRQEWQKTFELLQQKNIKTDSSCVSRLLSYDNYIHDSLNERIPRLLESHKERVSNCKNFELLARTLEDPRLLEKETLFKTTFTPAVKAITYYIEDSSRLDVPISLLIEAYPSAFEAVFYYNASLWKKEKWQGLKATVLHRIQNSGTDSHR